MACVFQYKCIYIHIVYLCKFDSHDFNAAMLLPKLISLFVGTYLFVCRSFGHFAMVSMLVLCCCCSACLLVCCFSFCLILSLSYYHSIIYPSIHSSINPSIYLSIYLSICTYVLFFLVSIVLLILSMFLSVLPIFSICHCQSPWLHLVGRPNQITWSPTGMRWTPTRHEMERCRCSRCQRLAETKAKGPKWNFEKSNGGYIVSCNLGWLEKTLAFFDDEFLVSWYLLDWLIVDCWLICGFLLVVLWIECGWLLSCRHVSMCHGAGQFWISWCQHDMCFQNRP